MIHIACYETCSSPWSDVCLAEVKVSRTTLTLLGAVLSLERRSRQTRRQQEHWADRIRKYLEACSGMRFTCDRSLGSKCLLFWEKNKAYGTLSASNEVLEWLPVKRRFKTTWWRNYRERDIVVIRFPRSANFPTERGEVYSKYWEDEFFVCFHEISVSG